MLFPRPAADYMYLFRVSQSAVRGVREKKGADEIRLIVPRGSGIPTQKTIESARVENNTGINHRFSAFEIFQISGTKKKANA